VKKEQNGLTYWNGGSTYFSFLCNNHKMKPQPNIFQDFLALLLLC